MMQNVLRFSWRMCGLMALWLCTGHPCPPNFPVGPIEFERPLQRGQVLEAEIRFQRFQ
jgi:hypothetical protein